MSTYRKASGVAGLVAAATLAASAALAQPLVIDATTGEPIQITGLSGDAMATLQGGGQVAASTPNGEIVLRGEIYGPGIWTDPDGCQHWVMDDGIEGYMAPILTRHGMPVCNGGKAGRQQQIVIKKYDVPTQGKGHAPAPSYHAPAPTYHAPAPTYHAPQPSHGYVETW